MNTHWAKDSVGRHLATMVGAALVGVLGLAAIFISSEKELLLEERQSSVRQ